MSTQELTDEMVLDALSPEPQPTAYFAELFRLPRSEHSMRCLRYILERIGAVREDRFTCVGVIEHPTRGKIEIRQNAYTVWGL